MSQSEPLYRIRVSYSRLAALRYISHLDMHRIWERTLRRAGLPLAYSKGFNPNPRIHQASALPLGFLGLSEMTDFWMESTGPPDLNQISTRIQTAAPPGLELHKVDLVPLSDPALQVLVVSAEYQATSLGPINGNDLAISVNELLGSETLMREKRGKTYDLRPLVEQLEVSRTEPATLFMRLAAREGFTGRPEEVIQALNLEPTNFRIERLRLLLKNL